MINEIVSGNIPQGAPVRTFADGSEYWIVELRTIRVGLGHFRPGWVWSRHAGAQTGKNSQSHIGYIQSGAIVVATADGTRTELGPGDAFEVGPGHDAWVVGDETCVALDITVRAPDGQPLKTR